MYSKTVTIKNKTGLHARPASDFVSRANDFESDIMLIDPGEDGGEANAKSIILVLALGSGQGAALKIRAQGPDERQAVEALSALIESGFGELCD